MDSICCGMRIPKGKTGRGGGLQASLTPIVLLAVALSRPGLLEDRQDGSQHAKGIQVQRAVGDVVVLQVQPLVVLDVRASIAGPPAREAGLHLVVQRAAAVFLQLSRDEGARADDGHVAGHDVKELGQLV